MDVEDNSKMETACEEFREKHHYPAPKSWLGIRHLIVALLFMATFVGYASRVILSVAIVAMLKNDTEFPSFDWDKKEVEGLVLSSFFWGYSASQIPCGLLVQSYGSKWPLFAAMGVSSICVLLTPVAAIYGDWIATCVIRTLQGVTQAALFPGLHSAIAIWTPLEERGRLATIILCGAQFGTIIALPVGGFLIPSAGGWPSIFYVFGGIGVAWSIFWCFFGYNSPSEHPFISKEERLYIEYSISNEFTTKLKTPWREIFTSPAMWALIVTHCAENFGFWTLMAEIPTYFDAVLKFKIEDNGILSALPYLTMAGLSFVFGWMADFAFEKNWLTVVASRKIFNTLGFWIPAAALVALGFITEEQKTMGVVLLVLAVGFNAGNYTGFSLVHMDMSPNFASIMMGITNFAANVFSTIGTLLADSLIRADKTSTANWKIVFIVTAAMFFFGNLVFIIIGRADRQPWNEPDYKRNK
ncbi:hypothetical protein RUM44_008592 [Polyplax serrata]|uniref:Major facilitator superfamily (MFS) profile domain-containing protein n=1 Tax=Polyplax serrata TaxID=468196 RepID=A0ABR1BCM9_POLSC